MKKFIFFSLLSLLGETVIAQTTQIIKPQAFYNKLYADVNGDGKLESLVKESYANYSFGWYWQALDGTKVLQVVTDKDRPQNRNLYLYGSQGQLIADYNNDGIPDILFDDASYGDVSTMIYGVYRVWLALSNVNGYSIKQIYINTFTPAGAIYPVNFQPEKAITVDLNRDGKLDFFGMETNGNGKYAPVCYIQTLDGNFQRLPLPVVTDAEEIEKAQFSTGNTGSYSNNGLNFSGMSSNGRTYTSKEVVSWQAIDINRDGYPDLIDPTGNSFISLPDGRYYSADLSGSVSIADLNSDGVDDILLYGNSKAIVQMSQPDGTFKEVELMENANITAIHCRDLDGDGHSDVLLCLNTKDATAYLAFFRNQGNGSFKRTVKTFSNRSLKFNKLYDLNLNGRPTLLVEENNTWLRFDWDASFAITESKLLPDDIFVAEGCRDYDIGIYNGEYYLSPIIKDYYGDGKLGMHCYAYQLIMDNYSNPIVSEKINFIYQFDGTNTTPQQMPAPIVIPDKQSATVKLEWNAGTDDKTASGDLTYDVEISNNDGKLLRTNTQHTYLIAEAGTWPKGQLTARIRAVDTNGFAGSWSSPTTWNNIVQKGLFTISNTEITTADTLIVHSLSDAAITYNLRPNGKIIEQEGATTKIVFDSAGKKTIEAIATGGVPSYKTVFVNPLSIGTRTTAGYVFDINLSGKPEMFSNKIYTKDGEKWNIFESIDLSDVNINNIKMFDDYNMDGLPDVRSYISKGGKEYAWLINKGDMEFKTVEGFKTIDGSSLGSNNREFFGDFDNDGLMDYCSDRAIYRNLGNDTYKQQPLTVNGSSAYDILAVADFDRDGLLDLICRISGNATLMHNKGDWKFEEIGLPCPVYNANSVVDINGDGYPDITTYFSTSGKYSNLKYAMLGGKNLNFMETNFIGISSNIDWDNDGQVDYLVGDKYNKILVSNHGNPIEQNIELDISKWNCDMNDDGRPDTYSIDILSRYNNTVPTAPTTVYATQQGNQVIVNWSGATDKETPHMELRYNISIKEKGATGDGSYIWSPLNMTSDVATTCPTGSNHYRYATTLPMPLSRFVAGKTYEIRIQTIDNWYAHSPFSTVYEFTPTSTTLINIAAKGGVNQPVSYTLTDNSGTTPTIDADGGEIKDGTITWNTAGVKTITVTTGTSICKKSILIVDRPNLDLKLPEKVLAGQKLLINLPEDFKNEDAEITIKSTRNGIDIDYDVQNNTVLFTMPETDGFQKVNVTYTDAIFGTDIATSVIEVVGANWQPTMTVIGMTENHNLLTWPIDQQLPDASMFNNKVNIYRETSVSDVYELIGETDISTGQFEDVTSAPDVKANRYCITLQTFYGVESKQSLIHGNIHLMVNRGQGNDINLHWTPYEGAKIGQYRILAGSSADNLQEVERLSGYAQSYTHKRNSDATTYYAIAYTIKDSGHAVDSRRTIADSRRAITDETYRSNIISSDEAHDVTLVKSIAITTKEGSTLLNKDQQVLHMQAIVTPVVATLGDVEWSILSGEDLAEISSNGTLTIHANTTGGTVTIQARTIDGSDIATTMNITVEKMVPTSIESIDEQNEASNRKPYIEVYTISGKKLIVNSLRALPQDIYIINGRKIMLTK